MSAETALSLMKSRRFIDPLPGSKIPELWRRPKLEFAFGLQPIIKFLAWQGATFQIDFMCAEPDFFGTRSVVCGNIFKVRLNLTCASSTVSCPSLRLPLPCNA